MKKKLMASILCLSLLLIMLLGSTLAWFTDDVGTTNTMVVGNVKIEQHEQYRNETGVLANWPDTYEPAMFPVVIKDANLPKDADGLWVDTALNNEIDKIVTVENAGDSAAYVRTVFAFEMMAIKDNSGNITGWENPLKIEANNPAEVVLNVNEIFDAADSTKKIQFVDFTAAEVVIYKYQNGTYGVDSTDAVAAYVIGIYTYKEALAAPTTTNPSISAPSLLQFYLADHVGNEFYQAVGKDGYQILVLSQAVQTQGFENAEEALTAAFGALSDMNAVKWFTEMGK